MSTVHKEPNYMAVFAALAVLTVLEIGVVYVPMSKLLIGIILILLALAKAALVALYFMHLKYEKLALGVIALTPLIICTILIIGLLPDLTGTPHASQMTEQAQVEAIQGGGNGGPANQSMTE